MQLQSIEFLAFFFAVCLFYYIVPGKLRKYWLLLTSWVFYLALSIRSAVYLAGISLLSYLLGLAVASAKRKKGQNEKTVLALAVVVTFAALAVVKYGNFVMQNINGAMALFGVESMLPVAKILQPVGLSFFTFQAVGYLVDVYRGTREAERNLVSYALFLSFFPIIMSGPIERSTNFLAQIDESHKITLDTYKVRHGLLTMLYGYFLKIMVADRLNILVNTVFADHESYGGCILALAVVAFGIQLYCDFAGISTIALGAGEVMGFSLIQNFQTPYFSTSIAEFWRRWHISLSSWFRDYLYIPLGGSRRGTVRKYLNLMIVFLVSGLWHGAGWSFIVWGGLHGVYQIAGDILKPVRRYLTVRCGIDPETAGNRVLRMVFNFVIVDFAWLFFRAESLTQACQIISHSAAGWNPWELCNGTLLSLGLDWPDMTVLILALVVVMVMSVLQYRQINWQDGLLNQGFIFRMVVYVICIVVLLVFGIYGPSYSASSFIYVDF